MHDQPNGDTCWSTRAPAARRHQSGSMPFDRSVAFEDSEARKRSNSPVAARCPLPTGMAAVKTMSRDPRVHRFASGRR